MRICKCHGTFLIYEKSFKINNYIHSLEFVISYYKDELPAKQEVRQITTPVHLGHTFEALCPNPEI